MSIVQIIAIFIISIMFIILLAVIFYVHDWEARLGLYEGKSDNKSRYYVNPFDYMNITLDGKEYDSFKDIEKSDNK